MLDLTTLATLPASCSGWGFTVGPAAARVERRLTAQEEWPAGVMRDADPGVRDQLAALLADDVLIELAHFAETGDSGHLARARRIVAIFGPETPALLARLLLPYVALHVPPGKGEGRADQRVRRAWLTAAVDHELERKRRGLRGAVPHAKAACERVGAAFGIPAVTVRQTVKARGVPRTVGGRRSSAPAPGRASGRPDSPRPRSCPSERQSAGGTR